LSDFAILCRTRNQFEAITKALLDHHVPYQEVGTAPFFRQEPFHSFADLLNALLFESWERAAPVFQLRKQQFSQLDFDLTRSEMKKSELIPFLNFLKENYFETGAFSAGDWNRFVQLAGKTDSAEDLVQLLKLGSGTDTHDKKLEAVAVMTLHASKGLEFECVFIPGCENGLLPYNLYKSEVDEEEEKRLLYVGMTRAKKYLYLTWARNRILRGRKFNLPKSSFIQSIQEELLQQIQNKPRKKPEEKDNQLSLF
jgi:DNA helicase II / ATP-dependent DNA helicase PcrA